VYLLTYLLTYLLFLIYERSLHSVTNWLQRHICFHIETYKSRDSSVGIALGYGLDDRGSRVRFPGGGGGWEFFSSPPRPERLWGPPSISNGYQGVKRPGREADHSPPSSIEVKGCVELYLHSRNTSSWRGA
jgi:hypothetical protein